MCGCDLRLFGRFILIGELRHCWTAGYIRSDAPASCITRRRTAHLCTLTDVATLLKLIQLLFFTIYRSLFFFFTPSFMSWWWRLSAVLLPPCQVCASSPSLRLSTLSIPPRLSLSITAAYSQFSSHCLSASHWYVKPPHSTHENEWPPCVEPAVVQIAPYSCGAYIVHTLTACQ